MATCAYSKHHFGDRPWIVFVRAGTDGWDGGRDANCSGNSVWRSD